MKKILFLFLFILKAFAEENSMEVKVINDQIVKGESFYLVFKIKTFSKKDPAISFNADSLEVLGRENRGTSMSTTIVNGRINSVREITYAYELVSDRARGANISDIKVDLEGVILKHPNIRVDILEQKKELPPFMAIAVPGKSEVFLGEGITVKYYLYFDASVVNVEIEDFPKLNDFVKRYYNIQEKPETVNYQGKMYNRISKYIVRLFPNKAGDLTIDPIKLMVHYRSAPKRSDFYLGYGTTSNQKKSVRSESVKIKVNSLPVENVPKDFTGLVGKHNFKVSVDKEKYLVNEAIQIRFEVEGTGNLENFDAPKILTNGNLEEFETKSDLSLNQDDSARKTFDYTFLTRGPMDLKEIELPLSYFDIASGKYVSQKIKVGNILVVGGVANSAPVNTNHVENEKKIEIKPQLEQKVIVPLGIIGPIFEYGNIKSKWIKFAPFVLGLFFVILLIFNFKNSLSNKKKISNSDKIIKEIKKSGINYSGLHRLLTQIREEVEGNFENHQSFADFVNALNISKEAKVYFGNLIRDCEESQFQSNKAKKELKFVDKYFKELQKIV